MVEKPVAAVSSMLMDRFLGKGDENERSTISYKQSSVKPVKSSAAGGCKLHFARSRIVGKQWGVILVTFLLGGWEIG